MLGKTDTINVGIVEFHQEGKESIRRLTIAHKKPAPQDGQIVSGGFTQGHVDEKMKEIIQNH